MPGEILDGVLPFAERIVGGRCEHASTVLKGALVVTIDVFHTHHYGMAFLADRIMLLAYSYRAIADVQLCSMICNSQAQAETEGIAEPVDSRGDVWIPEHGNYATLRHRPILEHGSCHRPAGYCGAASPGDCASGTSCAISHWINAWILLSIW
jgi:hypothetical protein